MINNDMKFIKRWEKIRFIGKRKYALLSGILGGSIYYTLSIFAVFIREYFPSHKFSIMEQVIAIIKEQNYLLIGFIIFFILNVIEARSTWERNENNYNEKMQQNETDEFKGTLLSNKKTFVYISAVLIFLAVYIYLNFNSFPYKNSQLLKTEVENYLMNKYNTEFIITDDISRNGNVYYVNCYPKIDSNIKFLTIWYKGHPEEATDTYIDNKLKYPFEAELSNYIKLVYGYDTVMYFDLYSNDIFGDMKDMENQDIFEEYKDKISLELEYHIFINELDQTGEVEKAYTLIENYLQNKSEDWNLHIYFYSKDFKDDFMKQYKDDGDFFRFMDTVTVTTLYTKGQLINSLHLSPGVIKEEAMAHYYYK